MRLCRPLWGSRGSCVHVGRSSCLWVGDTELIPSFTESYVPRPGVGGWPGEAPLRSTTRCGADVQPCALKSIVPVSCMRPGDAGTPMGNSGSATPSLDASNASCLPHPWGQTSQPPPMSPNTLPTHFPPCTWSPRTQHKAKWALRLFILGCIFRLNIGCSDKWGR